MSHEQYFSSESNDGLISADPASRLFDFEYVEHPIVDPGARLAMCRLVEWIGSVASPVLTILNSARADPPINEKILITAISTRRKRKFGGTVADA